MLNAWRRAVADAALRVERGVHASRVQRLRRALARWHLRADGDAMRRRAVLRRATRHWAAVATAPRAYAVERTAACALRGWRSVVVALANKRARARAAEAADVLRSWRAVAAAAALVQRRATFLALRHDAMRRHTLFRRWAALAHQSVRLRRLRQLLHAWARFQAAKQLSRRRRECAAAHAVQLRRRRCAAAMRSWALVAKARQPQRRRVCAARAVLQARTVLRALLAWRAAVAFRRRVAEKQAAQRDAIACADARRRAAEKTLAHDMLRAWRHAAAATSASICALQERAARRVAARALRGWAALTAVAARRTEALHAQLAVIVAARSRTTLLACFYAWRASRGCLSEAAVAAYASRRLCSCAFCAWAACARALRRGAPWLRAACESNRGVAQLLPWAQLPPLPALAALYA